MQYGITMYDYDYCKNKCVGKRKIGEAVFGSRDEALLFARLAAEEEADELNGILFRDGSADEDESFGVCEDEERLRNGYIDINYYTDKVTALVRTYVIEEAA